MRIRRCRNCHEPVVIDNYGEPVHVDTNKYGCEDSSTVAE